MSTPHPATAGWWGPAGSSRTEAADRSAAYLRWAGQPPERMLQEFDSSMGGLSRETAEVRLREDGPNVLPAPTGPGVPRMLARQLVHLARCRAAGIRVIMITGDHPATAVTVARRAGLADGSARWRGSNGCPSCSRRSCSLPPRRSGSWWFGGGVPSRDPRRGLSGVS